jgi:hypothetical protein
LPNLELVIRQRQELMLHESDRNCDNQKRLDSESKDSAYPDDPCLADGDVFDLQTIKHGVEEVMANTEGYATQK